MQFGAVIAKLVLTYVDFYAFQPDYHPPLINTQKRGPSLFVRLLGSAKMGRSSLEKETFVFICGVVLSGNVPSSSSSNVSKVISHRGHFVDVFLKWSLRR